MPPVLHPSLAVGHAQRTEEGCVDFHSHACVIQQATLDASAPRVGGHLLCIKNRDS